MLRAAGDCPAMAHPPCACPPLPRRLVSSSPLQGDTGCGKTTQAPPARFELAISWPRAPSGLLTRSPTRRITLQVPQFILEDAAERGEAVSIVCTQPRRISAMSVAKRVADERGERLGGTVGYSIRLESKCCAATTLLFCTTGILLRRLEEDSTLQGTTHVIVDEVHERSIESDFLLMARRHTRTLAPPLLSTAPLRTPPLHASSPRLPGTPPLAPPPLHRCCATCAAAGPSSRS